MKASLWTIIVEFRGGTYVSQVSETSPELAFHVWIKREFPNICRFAKTKIFEIDDYDLQQEATPLDGVKSVYCITLSAPRKWFGLKQCLMLLNIVKTKP